MDDRLRRARNFLSRPGLLLVAAAFAAVASALWTQHLDWEVALGVTGAPGIRKKAKEAASASDLVRVRDELAREAQGNRSGIHAVQRRVSADMAKTREDMAAVAADLNNRAYRSEVDELRDVVDGHLNSYVAHEHEEKRVHNELAKQIKAVDAAAKKGLDKVATIVDKTVTASQKAVTTEFTKADAALQKALANDFTKADAALQKAVDDQLAASDQKAQMAANEVHARVDEQGKNLEQNNQSLDELRSDLEQNQAALQSTTKQADAAAKLGADHANLLQQQKSDFNTLRADHDKLASQHEAFCKEAEEEHQRLQEQLADAQAKNEHLQKNQDELAAWLKTLQDQSNEMEATLHGDHVVNAGRRGAATFLQTVIHDVMKRSRLYLVLAFLLVLGLILSFGLGLAGLKTPGWLTVQQAFTAATGAVLVLALTLGGIILALADSVRTIRRKGDAEQALQAEAERRRPEPKPADLEEPETSP